MSYLIEQQLITLTGLFPNEHYVVGGRLQKLPNNLIVPVRIPADTGAQPAPGPGRS